MPKCNKCGKETKRSKIHSFCVSCEKKVIQNSIDDLVKNKEYHSARIRAAIKEAKSMKDI